MKILLCSLLLSFGIALTANADIHTPPASKQGPTRKLGRGVSNVLFAFTEVPYNMALSSDLEGGAADPYGFIKGWGRAFARAGVGLFEMLTFPFPTNDEKYSPVLRNEVIWGYDGYSEFPPELGWETRYNYVR